MKYKRELIGGEFVAPLPNWLTLKKLGINLQRSDANDKLQKVINEFDPNTGGTLYLEGAGKAMEMDKTITTDGKSNVAILADHPDTTSFKWMGVDNGVMFKMDSTAYSKFGRFTLDGNEKAIMGIEQSWESFVNKDGQIQGKNFFDTANEYRNITFKRMKKFGLGLGWGFGGGCEVTIEGCLFEDILSDGITLGDFNSLDVWIRKNHFKRVGCCVSNGANYRQKDGAGNYKVYNNFFEETTGVDLYTGNTGSFSIRGNYSIRSKMFYVSGFTQNFCSTTIADNKILDWKNGGAAIYYANLGPFNLRNNYFKSPEGYNGDVVRMDSFPKAEFLGIGNKFIKGVNPYVLNEPEVSRLLAGVEFLDRSEMVFPTPDPIVIEPLVTRPVIQINDRDLQGAIDKAVVGEGAYIYLPTGVTETNDGIIPQGSDVGFIGDSFRSVLKANLTFKGYCKPTFRDGAIHQDGSVTFEDANQEGSRVVLYNAQIGQGEIKDMPDAKISMFDGNLHGGTKNAGLRIENSTVNILSGSSSNADLLIEVLRRANVRVHDFWYETNKPESIVFSVEGDARLSLDTGSHAVQPEQKSPSILVKDLKGRLVQSTWAGNGNLEIKGNCTSGEILALGTAQAGVTLDTTTTRLNSFLYLMRYYTEHKDRPSELVRFNSPIDQDAIFRLLTDLLSVDFDDASQFKSTPDNASDIRVYRFGFRGKLIIKGNNSSKINQYPKDLVYNPSWKPAQFLEAGNSAKPQEPITPEPAQPIVVPPVVIVPPNKEPITPIPNEPVKPPTTDTSALDKANEVIKELQAENEQLKDILLTFNDFIKLAQRLGG